MGACREEQMEREEKEVVETVVGREGSFGATEESAATGVGRAKRRDSHTEDWCQPALTSPRGLSAHPLGQVGAGS